ncbi:MAG: FAD-dependent oxidoreductase [Pseudonocardiales bacterium]|nr:FAD-dependent oxidoreductase [Pseudonocardiales bacterium]MBV9030327.1 FAD-dependent oxidoreductase [Pseudonocardiales bacterium]
MHQETVQCCVVGGGPAGIMSGVLLARQGIDVLVLEKHADFLRDFRGDTIHPSTQELMYELGWLDEFQQVPHSRMDRVTFALGGKAVTIADFRKLKVHCRYIAFMPQWDFLDFLAAKGKMFPSFRLLQSTEVSDLLTEGGRVVGVRATTVNGPLEVRANLVVAADGRHSTCRAQSGLETISEAPFIDVLWFRLSLKDKKELKLFQGGKGILVGLDRGDFWQAAYVIPASAYPELRAAGLAELHARVASLAPVLRDRMHEVDTWDKVYKLTVRVDRLRTWHRPGLLCIGDAAHAMSPAGGVGINLAVQDAVATANILGPRLRLNTLHDSDLSLVQARRELPTRITQKFQVVVLRDLYPKDLNDDTNRHPPPIFTAFRMFPPLRHAMGRFIGLGVRPEHISN